MRIGLEFEKTGAVKYISHLDLQRAFSRTIRRAGLPVCLSTGFNPHYVMSFASALALGIESRCECVEMKTADAVCPDKFLEAMNRALPPGLTAINAVRLAENAPKLAAAVREAEYEIYFETGDFDKIKCAACDIMESDELLAKKTSKGTIKTIDIRKMIIGLNVSCDYLNMRIMAAPSGSLHPGMVIRALEARAGAFAYRIVRTGLFTYMDGNAIPLLSAYQE